MRLNSFTLFFVGFLVAFLLNLGLRSFLGIDNQWLEMIEIGALVGMIAITVGKLRIF